MEYQFLKVEHYDGITVMTISAPKSLNALNSTILKEIDGFIGSLDSKTRVLSITGDGEKSFVAGADISEMAHLDEPQGFEFGRLGAQVFRRIETLPIPVIAAVNGFALGGGCELAMSCDIRICSSNAKFGQPEVGHLRDVGTGDKRFLAVARDDEHAGGSVERADEVVNLLQDGGIERIQRLGCRDFQHGDAVVVLNLQELIIHDWAGIRCPWVSGRAR